MLRTKLDSIRDGLVLFSEEFARQSPVEYMKKWDSTQASGHRIPWPAENHATEGLAALIFSDQLKLTEALMQELQSFPQIKRVITRLFLLKQAGVTDWKKSL